MKARFVGDPIAGRRRCRLKFDPRDMWVGVYWQRRIGRYLDLYVCLIPMLPLHLWWLGPAEAGVERLRREMGGAP